MEKWLVRAEIDIFRGRGDVCGGAVWLRTGNLKCRGRDERHIDELGRNNLAAIEEDEKPSESTFVIASFSEVQTLFKGQEDSDEGFSSSISSEKQGILHALRSQKNLTHDSRHNAWFLKPTGISQS
ncbi:hypothetical protein R1flu_012218 [Riccia fluitans]|uniref:Uncharacterized protein n=1 Tax=Riccia fluitans TaxID=41844 RepID=A0ABD1ZA05_9MARC